MYSKVKYGTGREQFTYKFTIKFTLLINQILLHFIRPAYAGIFILLLPTIFIGCSDSVPPRSDDFCTHSVVRSRVTSPISQYLSGSTLDILTFNDDRLGRLDSYQRIEKFTGNAVYPTSTSGGKIIFLYYGSVDDRYGWAQINSISSLGKICCNLEDESRNRPIMTGQCRCIAGETSIPIDLAPLSCKVKLTQLQCDFSGTPYAKSKIRDVKAYLTNVNATCSIMPESYPNKVRLINVGMLNPSDIEGFKDRSILFQEITGELGLNIIRTDACFLCYPNNTDATRTTRLVIEGKIDGETYYWPLEVGDGEGISRNCSYEYCILIRRKGTSDPDILIDRKDIGLNLNVKQWEEKENCYVGF